MSLQTTYPLSAVPPVSQKGDHIFVDNVRFWCMFSIIAMHCAGILNVPGGDNSPFLQALFAPLKIGTIGFFLISGFLLGERVHQSNPLVYFRQRVEKVFLPWLLWFSVSVAMLLLLHPAWNRALATSGRGPVLILAHWVRLALFSTALWFVPNLICGIGILLLFRRYLHKIGFGLVLGLVNLFYVVDVYKAWIPNGHTEAIFGYVVYLWMGAFAALHQVRFRSLMARIPASALLGLSLLLMGCSFAESRLLTTLGTADATNTLRGSNQILSVVVVLLLFKVRRPAFPSFISVRKHTFGLYFSHSLLLILVRGILEALPTPTHVHPFWNTTAVQLSLWLVCFVSIYSACLLICKWLANHPRLQWTIGVNPDKTRQSASQISPTWAHTLRKRLRTA